MRSPIDRIENVRASVDDVERQMQACQAAGVQIPPNLAWRLLSECRSLLGHVDTAESALRAPHVTDAPGGCDVCGAPHVAVSTPGGIRFCERHLTMRAGERA